MSLVKTAAHLLMCGCALHGSVVYADGRKTGSFFTKSKGLDLLRRGKEKGLIDESEFGAVKEQILETSLELSDTELDGQGSLLNLVNVISGNADRCPFGVRVDPDLS